MFFANYILKDRVSKIRTQHKNLKTNSNDMIGSEKSKSYSSIYDMKLALEELFIATSDHDYKEYISFLNTKLDDIKNLNDILTFSNILEQILNRFQNINFEANVYTNYEYRTYNSNKDINIDFIRSIASRITTERKINIFDTQCRKGKLLQAIKDIKVNAMCYGLENTNSYAEAAKEHAVKIIKGQIKGSRIKNEAFDLLIANCDIKTTLQDNMAFGSIMKEERSLLQNVSRYIAEDGVIIIGLPFYRLYKDICSLIAKQFSNVHMVRGFGNENEDLHMVYIIGQKANKKSIDEDIYNMLRKGYDYNKIKSIFDSNIPDIKLRNQYIEIDLFKGSVLDMEELYNIVQTSGCMKSLMDKQKVDKINENTKKPLLPFNVGQIGLVLTSGCLDGIIDEGDGHYHLVKGRVSKKSEVTREISDGVLEEKEVVSNRVEINVILPNGEFKTLA